MRRLANILALACFAVLVVALWTTAQHQASEAIGVARATSAVRRVEQVIKLKATVHTVSTNQRGWPVTIDPAWFEDDLPRNPLIQGDHPWLEVAGPDQAGLTHPPVRMAVSSAFAGLWYNPYQGIVRARVPVMVSDAKSTSLYNRVNGTSLRSILDVEHSRDEPFIPTPGPHGPGGSHHQELDAAAKQRADADKP